MVCLIIQSWFVCELSFVFNITLTCFAGWRPSFKYYSMYVALLGSALCLAMMFIIQWWAALITFACVAALYLYVHYKKPGQWLDSCNNNGEGLPGSRWSLRLRNSSFYKSCVRWSSFIKTTGIRKNANLTHQDVRGRGGWLVVRTYVRTLINFS